MNKYLFQIVINNGEYATDIKVSAEDMDDAKLEAEIKARNICSKNAWIFRKVEFWGCV